MNAKKSCAAGGVGHTPGPWTFGYYGCNGYCIQGGGQHIATSILYKKDGGEANARLIAAAPDLLEACKRLLGCMALANWEGDPTSEFARAAIAAATGASK